MRVPTPIPRSAVRNLRQFFSGSLTDVLWKLFVVAFGTVVFAGLFVATGGAFLVAFLIGTVLSIVFADDLQQFVRDVWNRNFWVWRV